MPLKKKKDIFLFLCVLVCVWVQGQRVWDSPAVVTGSCELLGRAVWSSVGAQVLLAEKLSKMNIQEGWLPDLCACLVSLIEAEHCYVVQASLEFTR